MTTVDILETRIERTWWQRHNHSVRIAAWRLLALSLFLALWQYGSGRWFNEVFMSRPTEVVVQFVTWIGDGTLLRHTGITALEVALSFVFGSIAGIVAAFVLAALKTLDETLQPFIYALYSLPKVALAPMFIVWFGIGVDMKVILGAMMVFFLVFLNTLEGIKSIDDGLIDAVRLMNANKRQILTRVLVPGSMAGLIVGLKLGIPYALIGAVVGELVASNRGIGYLVVANSAYYNMAGVFAALFVLAAGAWLLSALVNALERRSQRWKPVRD